MSVWWIVLAGLGACIAAIDAAGFEYFELPALILVLVSVRIYMNAMFPLEDCLSQEAYLSMYWSTPPLSKLVQYGNSMIMRL